ncbi:MAG: hypothetical protein HYS27_11765 [Deltaproteobacteria bacterium]|nr:hypothetical protein [Deltaproteobacteria bacterium]
MFTRADVEFIEYLLPLSPGKKTLDVEELMTALMSGRRPGAQVILSPWGAAAAALVSAVVEHDHRLFPCALRAWVLSATCVAQMEKAAARASREQGNRSFVVRLGARYMLQRIADARGLFGTPFAVDVTDVAVRLRYALGVRGGALASEPCRTEDPP